MNNDIQYVNSRFHKKINKQKNKYMTEELKMLLLYVIISVLGGLDRSLICCNRLHQIQIMIIIILFYYNNSNKITIMNAELRCFRQFSAYFGHLVYFGLSSNR